MQEVRKQKEKLEEKIMDIYRSPNNNTSNSKRKQGIFLLSKLNLNTIKFEFKF